MHFSAVQYSAVQFLRKPLLTAPGFGPSDPPVLEVPQPGHTPAVNCVVNSGTNSGKAAGVGWKNFPREVPRKIYLSRV